MSAKATLKNNPYEELKEHCDKVLIFIFSEASKIVMRYVAAMSRHGDKVDKIKEQLLQSNPVLEGTTYYYFVLLFYVELRLLCLAFPRVIVWGSFMYMLQWNSRKGNKLLHR